MTSKTKSVDIETKKRTRKVIKWEAAHEMVTCSIIALFLDNKDIDPSKLAMVGRKIQLVLESISQTVKEGKPSKEIRERRDNLELALSVSGITNSNVLESLDKFVALFDGVCHEV